MGTQNRNAHVTQEKTLCSHTQFWNPPLRQFPFVSEVFATLDASVLGLHGDKHCTTQAKPISVGNKCAWKEQLEHAVCDQVVYLLVVVLRSGVKPTQAELNTMT